MANMKGKCDCYDCKYYKEVFMDDFDEWWMFCRKQQCVISVGMRAVCEMGVSKDDGQAD